ncbi:hypothetical protein ACLBXM_17905 [Xanthobacteraceae bacterium A53D]
MGIAQIKVASALLGQFIGLMPSTYRVVGSAASYDDVVCLLVESSDISDEAQGLVLTCEVQDSGSTRTVRMVRA